MRSIVTRFRPSPAMVVATIGRLAGLTGVAAVSRMRPTTASAARR